MFPRLDYVQIASSDTVNMEIFCQKMAFQNMTGFVH